MNEDIDLFLTELKEGKSKRIQSSLDKLHSILRKYTEVEKKKDFSITTIGKISHENNGPGYESIRATKNIHYRNLIDAWAAKACTTLKKPPGKHNNQLPKDYDLLIQINDLALRGVFGHIITERNRYRNELNLLKSNINIVIDKRPIRSQNYPSENIIMEESIKNLLVDSEIEALKFSISDECMIQNNWNYTQAGQVKSIDYGNEIYPRGYINAIKKILSKIIFKP